MSAVPDEVEDSLGALSRQLVKALKGSVSGWGEVSNEDELALATEKQRFRIRIHNDSHLHVEGGDKLVPASRKE